jgi:tRNA G37 N-methylase Trm5
MELNKISDIILINDDCRNVQVKNYADRILMGYHAVDETHITKAIELSKDRAFLHLHPLATPDNYDEHVNKYFEWIKLKNVNTQLISISKIKDYSPGLHHIEIVLEIQK